MKKISKRTLTVEQKKLDTNLWIIALATMAVYLAYGMIGGPLMAFCKDSSVSVWPRLLVSAGLEFGMAGFGITLVCIFRKIPFASFGLKKENTLKAVAGTIICFLPYILYIVLSGQFEGYEPFSIMVTPDLHKAGILTAVAGTLVVAVVWGFFEGFNYAVIAEFISKRYPVKSRFFDWGALVCTLMGIMFHPVHFDTLGMIDLATTFVALYGMLMIRKYTKNSWGCVFAFMFIWNAI
ncbi:MAG: hypothetical protein IKR23_09575 [Lachnospiraceae bacterium]|nr:hypothetical protein [Lachnospiraceae bacterium]